MDKGSSRNSPSAAGLRVGPTCNSPRYAFTLENSCSSPAGNLRPFERTLSQAAWDGRTRPKPVVAVITGCASAYLSWPGGVKLYDPSHAQVAAHVTFDLAWNPLNRPVPPVNVSDAETVLKSSTTWPEASLLPGPSRTRSLSKMLPAGAEV